MDAQEPDQRPPGPEVADPAQQVVLEEEYDANYEPTPEGETQTGKWGEEGG